jgi:hypothetical protein
MAQRHVFEGAAVDPKSNVRRNAESANRGNHSGSRPGVASVPRLYPAQREVWRKFKRGGPNGGF